MMPSPRSWPPAKPRGQVHMGVPVSFGVRCIALLLARFHQAYPHMVLTLDFNDRTSDLIDEAMDLAIRVSTELAPGIVARKLSQGRLLGWSPCRGIWPSTAPLSTPMICCTTAALLHRAGP